jgi:hypothetical protein
VPVFSQRNLPDKQPLFFSGKISRGCPGEHRRCAWLLQPLMRKRPCRAMRRPLLSGPVNIGPVRACHRHVEGYDNRQGQRASNVDGRYCSVSPGSRAATGSALSATVAKAKLHGLIVDRKESGAPGEFASLTTESEVMDAVRRELGDAAADALLVSLADTPEAEPETPAETAGVSERGPGDTLN